MTQIHCAACLQLGSHIPADMIVRSYAVCAQHVDLMDQAKDLADAVRLMRLHPGRWAAV